MNIDPLLFIGTTTDPALPAAPFERVHYSFGQLLGADEFETDQRYHHVRHRLHQLALHGYGVAAGLGVAYAGDELKVHPGLAVDALGRDLFVSTVQCLPVPALHTTELWADFLAIDAVSEAPGGARDLRRAWVVLRYRSCGTDPVVAYGLGCGGSGQQERPSRTRDTFTIALEADAPAAPEPWVGRFEGPTIDGSELPASWRDAWLAHTLGLPGDLQNLFDGTHTETGIALARVTFAIADDGAGGERTVVLDLDLAVRPLLPRVQTAVEALSGIDLDGPDATPRLRLRQVETVAAVEGAPIELRLRFTGPVVHGTFVADHTVQAHALDEGWSPVAVTVQPSGPDPRVVALELAAVPAGTPIRLVLVGDGPTPIAGPDGLPLSGWSTDTNEPSPRRGRTVAHHLTVPSEAS